MYLNRFNLQWGNYPVQQREDISKRIIQDGPNKMPLFKAVIYLLVITVFVLVSATFLWKYFDYQAYTLFMSAEADMNQGNIAMAKEKGKKAAQHMAEALQFNKLVLGQSHPEIANDTLNLARCYDMSQNFEKANELHQKACDLFKKTKGPEDSEYAWSLVSFGDHYRFVKDREKALEYYNQAMPVILKIHGESSNEYKWTVQRIEMAQKMK